MRKKKVLVLSIGGLGTAAIKFSKSLGAHVTALSWSEGKHEKCLAIGADDFYACLSDPDQMNNDLAGKFDLIIDTSPANADVAPFMSMLKFNGTYCRVGTPVGTDQDFKFQYYLFDDMDALEKTAKERLAGLKNKKR